MSSFPAAFPTYTQPREMFQCRAFHEKSSPDTYGVLHPYGYQGSIFVGSRKGWHCPTKSDRRHSGAGLLCIPGDHSYSDDSSDRYRVWTGYNGFPLVPDVPVGGDGLAGKGCPR